MQSNEVKEPSQYRSPVATRERDLLKEIARPYYDKRKLFALVVGAQLFAIGAFAAPKAYTLTHGTEVLLQAQPVDPYDLFRGEYARLSFADIEKMPSTVKFQHRERVFVLLQKSPDHWRAIGVSREKPAVANDQVALAGTVEYDYGNYITIEYGFSRLYMPEGRSRDLERNAKDVKAIIAVDQSGNACIKRVEQRGRVIYDGLRLMNPFG